MQDRESHGNDQSRPASPDDRLQPAAEDAGSLGETEPVGPGAGGPGRTRRIPFRAVGDAGGRGEAGRGAGGDRAWFWPVVNLVGLAAVILVNWLANWLPLNDQTTGEIANRNPVPFQPAGWAFAIWIVIYALLLVFVVYGLLPPGRTNPRIQAVGPFFLVANIANITWLFLWHWEQFGGALVAMTVLLAALVGIYAMIRARGRAGVEPTLLQRLAVWTPFSVYLGWISVAILANIQIWMDRGGWDGGPFGLRAWAVIFMVAGVLVAAGVAFFLHDAAYTAVFVWAYLAIAQKQWDVSKAVSITAILLVVVAAAVTAMAFILAFDRRTMQGGGVSLRRRPSPSSGM